jgi:Rieske 2Fe-2S family protein
MDLSDGMDTMSLDGRSGGEPLPGLAPAQLREVLYVGLLPNVLVAAHPDYVLTHRLRPLAPDRTVVECEWLFPASVAARPGFDPAYAVDFWDLTNRQDWTAVESVQRNLASPAFVPGRLAPQEDAVYAFVNQVARAYAGVPVGETVP